MLALTDSRQQSSFRSGPPPPPGASIPGPAVSGAGDVSEQLLTDGFWRKRTGFYASEEHAPSKQEAKACLLRALELGVSFYNSSNMYGPYTNEELIGE